MSFRTGWKSRRRITSLFQHKSAMAAVVIGICGITYHLSMSRKLMTLNTELRINLENYSISLENCQKQWEKARTDIQKLKHGHVVNLPRGISNKPFFLSYSQAYEDLILYDVFKNISEGFYIDVGANNPVRDSVTKAFYEIGWHGINIEPLLKECNALVQDRPRDINLCIAAGSKEDTLELHERGTLSTLKADEAAGWNQDVQTRMVKVEPLSKICNDYCKYNQSIQFLKIDVEGFEREVLMGTNLRDYRPNIIILESTKPRSAIPTHNEWEDILKENGYIFAIEHSINRYYVDKDLVNIDIRFKPFDQLMNEYIVAKN